MKGLAPLVSMVLTILFVVIALGIALTTIKPTLEKSKAFAVYSEGIQNLQLLDSAIREVASEAQGSRRTITLTVTDGEYKIDPEKELLYFEYNPPVDLKLSGRAGNAWVERGFVTGDWFNSYTEGSNASERWHIISGKWDVESGTYVGVNGTTYFSVGKELDGFSYAVDIQNENGKGEAWVEPVDPKDLVGFWTFDEGSGNLTYDYSGHNNTGKLMDANATNADGDTPPKWVDGKFGKALEFDGVDDYVEVPNSPSLNISDAITVIAWANFNTFDLKWHHIIGKARGDAYDRYYIAYTSGDNFVFGYYGQDETYHNLIVPRTIGTKKWHMFAFTFNGTELTAYIDGVQKGTLPTTAKIKTGNDVTIGQRGNDDSYFNGTIDEIRIYNVSLSSEQIKELYELGLKKLEASGEQTIDSTLSPYIVLSNPFGKTYFDALRVDAKKDKTIYVIMPYNTIDLQGNFRISKGNYQIVVENYGTDSNGKPIVKLTVE